MEQLELPYNLYQVCAVGMDNSIELLCLVNNKQEGAEFVFSELAARGELYDLLVDDYAYNSLDEVYGAIECGDVVGGYSVQRAY